MPTTPTTQEITQKQYKSPQALRADLDSYNKVLPQVQHAGISGGSCHEANPADAVEVKVEGCSGVKVYTCEDCGHLWANV